MKKTLFLFFLWGLTHSALCATDDRPHVIFILADDMGYGDLGIHNGGQTSTPYLDKMAAEGTRFSHYYSAAPICSPSRVGTFTGMFPARWRIHSFLQTREGNHACEQADFLDPAAPSIARQMKAAGYATAHFGKWHMGGGRDVTNAPGFAAYGFDEHAGTWESPEPHPDITGGNWIWGPNDKIKRWDRTAFFVDKTLDFLARRHSTQPCFVQVWFDDVHTPWVPDEHAARGDTPGNFRPVLRTMDQQIGRLLAGLQTLGIDTNTLVIFTSDNGPLPTFQGARAAGLRGSKLSLYEGGVRMPFIVRWPGHIPAGRVDETTITGGVDLLPTICAFGAARLPTNVSLDGENMRAAWLGKRITRKQPLFWEYGRRAASFHYPRQAHDRSPQLAILKAPWKLLINADGSDAQLFNILQDHREENNIAASHPEIAQQLTKEILAWKRNLP